MNISIKVTGIRDLTTTISNAHPKAVKQATQVTKNNTEEMKKDAKRRAPWKTEFLKNNIVSRYYGMTGEVNSKAGYSGFQEFGTRFMDAQSFMFPALQAIQESYEKDMTDVMKGVFK